MEKLRQAQHFIKVWMDERWWGNQKITITRTDNVLTRVFKIRGVRYHFECSEYCYTVVTDKWYISDNEYYMYHVVMSDGDEVTTGTYPLMSLYHIKTYQYGHHLAIRAHIQTHIR